VKVWWDFNLYAGDSFREAITNALDESKAVVVIWSKSSVLSPWVRDEATRAARQNKLVTVHVPDFDLADIPLGFGQLHCESVEQISRLLLALSRHQITVLNATNQFRSSARSENVRDSAPRVGARNDAANHCARAFDYLLIEEPELAIGEYTKAIALEPRLVAAHNGLAFAYLNTGKYDLAFEQCKAGLACDPKNGVALYARAIAHYARKEHDQAIADCTRAIQLDPPNANLYYTRRGSTYQQIGSHDRAIEDFNRAIALDPGHIPAINGRAYSYLRKGEFDRALVDSEEVVKRDPQRAGGYHLRSQAHKGKGDAYRADLDNDKFMELWKDPSNRTDNSHLNQLAQAIGRMP
jgi:tetratricopeptide (TPR) repeat protein